MGRGYLISLLGNWGFRGIYWLEVIDGKGLTGLGVEVGKCPVIGFGGMDDLHVEAGIAYGNGSK